MVKALAEAKAFSFGATVGLKTLLVDKSGNALIARTARKRVKQTEGSASIATPVMDIAEIQEAASNYTMRKADLRQVLNRRREVYYKLPDTKDDILARLSTCDLLDLSDPLLPLKLPQSPSPEYREGV
jgi:hypothetical protein